jgi:hypothetical protein
VFSREIRTASFPQRIRQPTSIDKYTGEADPRVWLNDYRLACQLGRATTDEVIIRNLPLHLADSARTWLEHLPASQIHNWDDLVRTFVGNFQDTYVHPGNSWDLHACTQKPDESLRDFIRCFSKRCTELPSMAQSEIMHAFLEGTTCRDLMRELGRSPGRLERAVRHRHQLCLWRGGGGGHLRQKEGQARGRRARGGQRVQGAPAEEQARQERQEAAPGHDNDGDEALAVDPARRGPRAATRGPGVFDDMLKKPCPYHKTPVNHTLEQCDLIKRYYSLATAKDD